MSLASRLWARRHDRPLLVALAGLTVAAILAWPVLDFLIRGRGINTTPFVYYDFGVYSGAVERWLEGASIYTQAENGGYRGSYLYPPVTVLLFYPFYFVEQFPSAGTLFGALSLVLLWVGLELAVRELGYDLAVSERLLLLALLFGFQPAMFDFKMGQVGTFLAAMLAFGFYAHERGRKTGSRFYACLSGALTTVGSGFKIYYATSGAHLLRERRRLAAALATAGALVVVSFLLFGVEAHRTYLDVLAWGKGWGDPGKSPELWGPAYYRPLYFLGESALYVRLVGILAVIGLVLAARDAPVDRETFALGVAVVPLFPPEAYTQDLVVLLLPAVILLGVEINRDNGRPWLPVLAVLLLHVHAYGTRLLVAPPAWLPLSEVVQGLAAGGWLQPGGWATLLLIGLSAARVAEGARLPALAGRGTEAPGE
jgi:hypothetical protein